jgi:hypothetical protein
LLSYETDIFSGALFQYLSARNTNQTEKIALKQDVKFVELDSKPSYLSNYLPFMKKIKRALLVEAPISIQSNLANLSVLSASDFINNDFKINLSIFADVYSKMSIAKSTSASFISDHFMISNHFNLLKDIFFL